MSLFSRWVFRSSLVSDVYFTAAGPLEVNHEPFIRRSQKIDTFNLSCKHVDNLVLDISSLDNLPLTTFRAHGHNSTGHFVRRADLYKMQG